MNETQTQSDQEISLRDVYLILKRHVLTILIVPLALMVLAAVYAVFIADPVYKADSKITIQTTPVQSRLEDKIETTTVTPFTTDQIQSVALSRPVLDPVLEVIRTSNDAPSNWRSEKFDADDLERKLKVTFPKANARGTVDASLVTLEVSAPDAKLAAEVANVWAVQTLAVLNRLPQQRLNDSIKVLEGEILRSQATLTSAEKGFRSFTESSNLSLNQAELSSMIDERAKLDPQIAQTQAALTQSKTELVKRTSDLRSTASTFGGSSETSPDEILALLALGGGSLAEAKRVLSEQVEQTRARYEATSDVQRDFNASNETGLLSSRIAQNEGRLVEINGKLQSFDAQVKTLQSRLDSARAELAKQPRLLTLEREITSDPAVQTAITSNDPELKNLIGLKLQNQELNPVYQGLLNNSIQLQSDIQSLTAERNSLQAEKTRRETQLREDRNKLAKLQQRAEQLGLDARNAQNNYELSRTRFQRLDSLGDTKLGRVSVSNSNPEYQRIQTLVNDLSASIVRNETTLQTLQARATQLDTRIAQTKRSVGQGSVQSARVDQQLGAAREEYKALTQKLTDLKIELASSKTLAQVLVPAFAPSRSASSRFMVVLLAGVIGLLIGLVVPFVLEALRDPQAQRKPSFTNLQGQAADD
jgi:uncharacterized protein involved in exopolysaccharide biosynthesis